MLSVGVKISQHVLDLEMSFNRETIRKNMTEQAEIDKIKKKIDKNEHSLQTKIKKLQSIWEDTGLDPKDQSYLIEKTMRFEMAQTEIGSVFSLFGEIIEEYKKLCKELEKLEE